MIFGNREEFAVEAFHENLSESDTNVFGRMCLWFGGEMLGDLLEPQCMLDVTIGFFESLMGQLSELRSKELSGLSDLEAYNYLNNKLYDNDERTAAQMARDSEMFFKFDFLTNGGESFDNSKSFIVADEFFLRVLFYNYDKNKFTGYRVSKLEFASIVKQFMAWHCEVKSKLAIR